MSSKSKSESKSKVDWSLESALASLDENGIYKKLNPGLYEAIISTVELKKFDSGAEGFIIEYQLDEGPKKRETLWAVTKAGKPLPGFKISIAQRLMHLGYSLDFIRGFKGPQKAGGIGQWEQVINDEQHILLRLDYGKENDEGKSYLEVKQTYKPGTIVDVVDEVEATLLAEIEVEPAVEEVVLKHVKKSKPAAIKAPAKASDDTNMVDNAPAKPVKFKAPKPKVNKLASQRIMADPSNIAVSDESGVIDEPMSAAQ